MADKKIINLTAIATQATTDLYETSANGTGSFKETRAQQLTYTKANIAGAPYVIGDLIFASSTSALGKIADIATGNVLISGGIGASPSYGKVTYGHLQIESAVTLLGNPAGAPGAVSEITLGAGLAFSGTTLISTVDSSVTLQDAYGNGDGTITSTNIKPVKLNISSTFTGAFNLSSDNFPIQLFTSTNGASNEKNSCFIQTGVGSPGFYGALVNDTLDDSTNWIEVIRTGFTPTSVNFPNGTLKYAGSEVAKASQIIVTTWDGSSTPVAVTAGTGISIASGVISATGDQTVTLQDAFDNGTPTAQGSILLTADNLNPIAAFATSTDSTKLVFEAVNNIANSTGNWGYGFRGPNSLSNYTQFARIQASAPVATDGAESARLLFLLKSGGASLGGLLIDGVAQEVSSPWPITAPNILTMGTDFNGVTIASQTGSTGASVINSQSIRMGNAGTSTGKITFTATDTTGNILINPPFGASFTAVNQASGTAIICRSSGSAIGDGIIAIVNSASGQGVQFNFLVSTGSGSYDIYFSIAYSITN